MSVVGLGYAIYNESNITGTSYTSQSNLAANTQYIVSVYAYKSGNIQVDSESQKIWILNDFYDDVPLDVPQNVKATAGTTSVTVSFQAVPRATGYDILFNNTVYSANTTSHTFNGLKSNTAYTYAVRAKNAAQTGAYSNTQTVMTQPQLPAMPVYIQKTATETSAVISWRAVSGATGYDIKFDGVTYSTGSTSRTFNGLAPGSAYVFAVRARNADGVSAYTNEITVATPPKAPAVVNAAPDSNSVAIQWDAVEGAAGYIVRFNNRDNHVSGSATSCTIGGLTQKTEYPWQICCKSADGSGEFGGVRYVTTLPYTPGVPYNIRKVAEGTSVTISWRAVAYATAYKLLFDGAVHTLSGSAKTFTGLRPNTSYPFKLCAENDSVTGNYTAEITVTTAPAAPGSINAVSTANSVTVSWEAVQGAAGYTVSFNGTKHTMTASSTSRTFTGLNPDTPYAYQVCSRSVDGDGVFSGVKTIRTLIAAPSGISHSATDDSVTVNWSAVSGASGYEVLFGKDNYTTTGTSKRITGLPANTAHSYRVRAKAANGTSGDYSPERTVRTTPKAPESVSASTSESSATVSWGAVSGASGYDLLFNGTAHRTTKTSHTVTGLRSGTSYSYRIRSNNADGSSSYGAAGSISTQQAPPAVPGNISATSTIDSVTVNWSAVHGASGYDVQLGDNAYAATGTSRSISGLKSDTEYTYRVRAKNAVGSSAYSVGRTIRTKVAPPAVPSNVRATPSTYSVAVAWNAVQGATGYELRFGGSVHKVTGTSKTVTGLSPKTSYSYQVRAKNSAGTSAYSVAGQVRTLDTPPAVPQDVRATSTTDTVTVYWKAVSNAGSYKVRLNGDAYGTTSDFKKFTNLEPDTAYTYAVCGVNEGGSGQYSAQQTIRTKPVVPEAPHITGILAEAHAAEITWNQVPHADSYELLFDGTTYAAPGVTKRIEGLQANTEYICQVRAKNQAGVSADSEPGTLRTRLDVPENTGAEAFADKVVVYYDPVDGAAGYDIDFDGVLYDEPGTSKTFGGLEPETEHHYAVRAKNQYVDSLFSRKKSVKTLRPGPAMPSGVTAAATMDSVIVSWRPIEDAQDYDVRFDGVEYRVAENGTVTLIPQENAAQPFMQPVVAMPAASGMRRTAAGPNRSAVIGGMLGDRIYKIFTGLRPNTQHSYSVRANNAEGSSPYTAEQYITTDTWRAGGMAPGSSYRTYPDGRISYTGNDPVNALTGAFLWSRTWLEDFGKDKLHFTTMYDSRRDAGEGVLGRKWTHALNYRLDMDETHAYFYTPYGDAAAFDKAEDGSYVPVNGEASIYDLKANEDGSYSAASLDGTEYVFDENLCQDRIVENGLVSYRFLTDGAGRIVRIEGRHGAGMDITYTDGRIAGVTDAMGNTVRFSYDNGRLESVTDAAGRKMSFTYDEACNLLTVSDFSGRVYLTNVYDVYGRVTEQLTAGRGRSFAAYDDGNRMTGFTDELGNVTKHIYDESGHVTDIELAGTAIHNSYNEKGQLTAQTDALGNTTQMEYDEYGRMNRVVYPDGTEERAVYNDNNRPVKITGRDGAVKQYRYDVRGNLIEMQDERGNTNSYTYDENDNLTAFTDRIGNVWTYAYDENNHLEQATDPDGNVCGYTHDAIGRMTSYTSPAGRTVSYRYSAAGELLSVENADGETFFAYDANGSRTEVTDKMGNTQHLEYNEMGQVSLAVDSLGNEYRYAYDEKGNLVTETDPLGYSIGRTYDAFGNRISQTDKNGGVTHYSFDAANRLVQMRDAAGGTVSYTYDCMGQVTTVTDSLSHQRTYTYDSAGRVLSETDPLEHSVSYTYDKAGNLLTKTDEDGSVTAYAYDAENRVKSIQTGAGTTTFAYDKLGRLISVTDTDGYTENAAYDCDGNLTEVSDKESHKTVYAYDGMGRIAQETAPDGGKTAYAYDKNGNCIQITDAEGHVTGYEYDACSRMVKATDPLGQVTLYTYDGRGQLAGVTDANGNTTQYAYDGNGNRISETSPIGGKKTYVYDSMNRMTGVTDEEGNAWTCTYDAAGNRTSVTDANGNTWTYAYDANNRLISVTGKDEGSLTLAYTNTGRLCGVTDMEGAETAYRYDALGRLTGISDALGHGMAFTYDSAGRLLTQTDANGNTTQYAYSPAGNLLSVTDAEGNATTYTYNAAGQILTQTDALGNTVTYTYDLLGQATSMTDALGGKTTFTYTADGRIATVENAEGNVTQYAYDACGNLIRTEDALGKVVLYEYDAMNNRIRECLSEDGEQRSATIYQYDKKGRMIKEINPVMEEKSYSYDGNDNLVSVTDEQRRETVITYDLNNQPVSMNYSDGRTAAFRYNKRGELVEMQDWNGSVLMERDSLGRLTAVTDPNGRRTGYAYDAAGNRTGLLYPDGSAATFAYDRNNRLLTVTENADASGENTKETIAQYAYDAAGSVVSLIQPGSTAAYTYNANRQPIKAAYRFGETAFMEETITYDIMGRIAGTQRSGSSAAFAGAAAYAYDAAGQLVSYQNGDTVEAYTYDALGNRTARSINGVPRTACRYNALNQITALSEDGVTYSFGYDKCGSLTEERRDGELLRQYAYDTAGRMILGKNLENGAETAYTYNALDMCVKNVQSRPIADGLRQREMQYIPDFLSATRNELMAYETGADSIRTVFGNDYQRLSQSVASQKTYFQSDIYGSPLFAADGQGAVQRYADRTVWGSLKSGTEEAPGLEENLRFTSYRYDPVIGKYFAQARFYDPANGRMLSPDPIKRDLNPYRYCDNDPADYVDPTGEVLHIFGGITLGGIFGFGGGFIGSVIDQKKRGRKIDWRKAFGSGINGAITGAAQGGLLAAGAGLPAALLTNFFAGTAGSAAEQYIGTGRIDPRRSITRGLTNAISNAIYGTNPLRSAREAFLRGAGAGAATSGINYLSDVMGSGNRLIRDPRLDCGGTNPFDPSLGYHSDRGYRYDIPQSESSRKTFSMWDFLGEVVMGGLTGGFTSAAFYGAGKGIERLKEGVKNNSGLNSPLTLNLGEVDDNAINVAMKNAGESTPKEFKVFGHGNPKGIQYKDQILNADQVADLIRNSPQYMGGNQIVKLYSCNTGRNSNGFAQQLADNLGVVVEAPNRMIFPTKAGEFYIADKIPWLQNYYVPGSWVRYRPRK